jgi:hypothetical protein
MMLEETNISEIELVTLQEEVINLHNIARHIEQTIGKGQLSEDIRHAADRLSEVINRF